MKFLDIFKVIKERRSIRKFKSNPVPDEHIFSLLEAARWAPTAGNIQPWRFIIIKDPTKIGLIKNFSPGLIGEPPLLIVICSDRKKAAEVGGKFAAEYTSIVDCAMATQNILLTAYALGLGTCVVKSFASVAVKEILGIPDGVEPELLVAVGYPDEKPKPPPKIPLEEIVYWEVYGQRWVKRR